METATKQFSIKHLLTGSMAYGSSDIVTGIVRFMLIGLYTRILSPAEFGLLAVIQTTQTLATVLLPLGLPSAIMLRMNQENPAGQLTEKNNTFFFLLCLSLCAGAVYYAGMALAFPRPLLFALSPWLILHVSAEMTSLVPKASLRMKGKIASFTFAKIVRVLCMISVLFYVLGLHVSGIQAIVMAEAAGVCADALLCMILDNYKFAVPSFLHIRAMLITGVPLTVVGFGLFCIDLSDRYVVFSIMGKQASGFYAAGAKIAIIASYATDAFNSMWFPYYLQKRSESNGNHNDLKRFSSLLIVIFACVTSLLMITLPLVTGLHIGSRFFIAPQFQCIALLIAPLILSYFFKSSFYIASPVLISSGRNWRLAYIVYIAAFVNILGDILLAGNALHISLLSTLAFIALMTSVSYGICMVWVSKQSGLFSLRFWVSSVPAALCLIMLCIPWIPTLFVIRAICWFCGAGYGMLCLWKSSKKT